MADQNQIQGLPEGAIVGPPLQPQVPQIEGLPEGAIVGPPLQPAAKPTSVAPISDSNVPGASAGLPGVPNAAPQMRTVATPSTVAATAADEAGNLVRGVVQPVKAAVMPPQDASEHAISSIGGQDALIAYRTAKGLHSAATNLIQSKKENFQQAAVDFANALSEFKGRNYRAAAADTASVVADTMNLPGTLPGVDAVRARELTQGTKEGGDLATPITRDAIDALAALIAEKAPEVLPKVATKAGEAVEAASDTASKAANKINTTELRPEALTKHPEGPAPQHGTPVKVESPLDGPTVGKQIGGKDLSAEALKTLNQHAGDTIPVGGTAKNSLMKAVEPTVRTINETASKMNDIVDNAPKFTTSAMTDSGIGGGRFLDDIEAIRKNLPPSVRDTLTQDVDGVMEDADAALNSTDPSEVLEYRRKLGQQIDWSDISKNPTTPAEVTNATRARVYRALGDKIHEEIPETVELDKTLQPNLELRSHMRSKLGDRVVDDPMAAKSEAQSEFKKGKTAVENAAHNEQVAKNWGIIKTAINALPWVGGGVYTLDKILENL